MFRRGRDLMCGHERVMVKSCNHCNFILYSQPLKGGGIQEKKRKLTFPCYLGLGLGLISNLPTPLVLNIRFFLLIFHCANIVNFFGEDFVYGPGQGDFSHPSNCTCYPKHVCISIMLRVWTDPNFAEAQSFLIFFALNLRVQFRDCLCRHALWGLNERNGCS